MSRNVHPTCGVEHGKQSDIEGIGRGLRERMLGREALGEGLTNLCYEG